MVISPAPKKRMHPIFSTTKTASCSAGGCSSAGCGSGSGNDNAAKTAKTLIRMRVLAKVAGPKQKECSDLQAANATVLVDCLDQDSLSAELDDTTSKLHFQTARAEKATARVAELETENECLREMLFDKIRQLEECQAKYDALKKELSKLRKSVSAYKRHGTKKTKGSKKRAAGSQSDDADAETVERLCMDFIQEAHGAAQESNLLEAMLAHPLMTQLADEALEKLHKNSTKYLIVEQVHHREDCKHAEEIDKWGACWGRTHEQRAALARGSVLG